MEIGKIISFEGPEAAGKTTQIEFASNFLRQNDIKVVTAREPGGTQIGEEMRVLIKHPNPEWEERTPESETFMFWVARSEFADKILRRHTTEGTWVIADRLHDSTTAYQGWGRFEGDPDKLAWIDLNNRIALQGLWPDITFLLDVPIKVMNSRLVSGDQSKMAYFETTCAVDFFERVRHGYLEIARKEPNRFVVIDGGMTIEDVSAEIESHLQRLIELHRSTKG